MVFTGICFYATSRNGFYEGVRLVGPLTVASDNIDLLRHLFDIFFVVLLLISAGFDIIWGESGLI